MLPLSYGLEVIHFLEHPIHNRPTIRSQEPPKRLKPEISLGPLNGSGEGGSGPTARQKEVELVFKDVCVSFEDKIILKDVSGMVRPGEILAIMGPSGSGKTTLLNTIGGRSEQMKITGGIVTVNGEEMNKQWRRKICYVMQQDVFFAELTLRETLEFSARLGLPDSMPYEQKMRQVDFIVDLLDLRACQDTIMGDVLKRGLSGGEKKRANIANELLQNPSLMLLDEPTSGLDSFTAFSLMDCLKKIVRENNKTLVVTVHQPSSQIFYMFDKLLLLCNGQVAYFGDTNKVVDFFSKIGMTIQEHYNPADFIMEKVKQSEEAQDKIIEAAIKQRKSDEYPKELQDPFFSVVIQPTSNFDGSNGKDLQPWSEINKNDAPSLWSVSQESVDPQGSDLLGMEDDKKMNSVYSKVDTRDDDDSGRSSWSEVASSAFSSEMDLNEENKWPTSFRTQLTVLTARNFKEARKRMLSLLNWVQTLALSLITGAVWFQIKRTEENIFNMLGYKFFVISYWMLFSLFGALMSFPPEREVVYKERISGAYRLSAYYISKMCGELSLVATLPSVYFAISYPMMGCPSFVGYIFMWLNLMLSTLVSQSVGLFIGALCIDLQKAVTASALFSLSTMLFGGFYASELAPSLSWVPYTSIVHYAYQNMQIIHFQSGEPIRCAANNSVYESCRRENSTGFISPEELIGEDALPLWANTVILFLYLVAFRLAGYYVLRFVRRPR